MITAREAANRIRKELMDRRLSFHKVSARTVGFSDLARCSKVIVRVEGWKPDSRAEEIKAIGNQHGFIVQFVTLQGIHG